MAKKMSMTVVFLYVVVLLSGFVSSAAAETENLAKAIEAVDPVAVVLIDHDGELFFYDTDGEPLEVSLLPDTDLPNEAAVEETEVLDGATPAGGTVCKGMGKDSAVTGIMALPIIKTNSTHCITLGPDASGQYYQICW